MRFALLAVLLAAFAQAHAQKGVLVSPLPEGMDNTRVLEVARQVLTARGWVLVPEDALTIEAKKDRSGLRVFVGEKSLRYSDRSEGRRMRQRNRDEGPQFAAIPQEEIDALRADLVAAFEGRPPVALVAAASTAPVRATGQVLLAVPAGADPQQVMEAARSAFARRKWAVSRDADGALIVRNRNLDIDATLRVFIGDGALRYIDGTVDRKGGKAQVPERWLNYIRADLRRPAPARDQNAAERLRQLQSLLDGGLITQAEYDAKRAEILKGL
jgi:putative oligomerization/nucleic acid binding protein